MKNSPASRVTSFVAATVAIVGTADSAAAATVNYDLTGDTNNVSITTVNGSGAPYTSATYNLTNTATGDDPGLTLYGGDILDGTITLNSPVTIPASNQGYGIQISLQAPGDTNIQIMYREDSVSYYDNGVQVLRSVYDYASDPLVSIFDNAQSTGGFAFNEIAFSATIFGFTSNTYQTVGSAEVSSLAPQLLVSTYPTPTPLPAAAWLMLSGLGALGALARNKRTI